MNKRDLFYIGIILVLAFCTWESCSKKTDSFEKIYLESQDSLHHTRNKLKQEKTTTNLLNGRISDFKKLRASDSSIIGRLQKIVNRNTISATELRTVSTGSFSGAEQNIGHDTTFVDGNKKYIYPTYSDTVSDKWGRFKMSASKDSFYLEYKIYNQFELTQQWNYNGLFKRKVAEATITNLNPNTETIEYKTFTVKENKSNRVRDVLIGTAAGFLITEAFHVFNFKIPLSF